MVIVLTILFVVIFKRENTQLLGNNNKIARGRQADSCINIQLIMFPSLRLFSRMVRTWKIFHMFFHWFKKSLPTLCLKKIYGKSIHPNPMVPMLHVVLWLDFIEKLILKYNLITSGVWTLILVLMLIKSFIWMLLLTDFSSTFSSSTISLVIEIFVLSLQWLLLMPPRSLPARFLRDFLYWNVDFLDSYERTLNFLRLWSQQHWLFS